jgi:hypothetical protein
LVFFVVFVIFVSAFFCNLPSFLTKRPKPADERCSRARPPVCRAIVSRAAVTETIKSDVPPPSEHLYGAGAVSKALTRALAIYRRQWEAFRQEDFAALGLDAAQEFARLIRTAESMVRGAGELASGHSLPLDQAVAGLHDGNNSQHKSDPAVVALSEALQYCLGRDAVEMVTTAEQRIWRLLLLTQQFQPSKRAAAFLRRVSRCYVYGFDPECAVMCRSVLQAAFDAEISDDHCQQVLGRAKGIKRTNSSPFDLADRIAVARKLGRISESSALKAAAIRAAGNVVIHEHPRACDDPFMLIADTMDVIAELTGSGKGA